MDHAKYAYTRQPPCKPWWYMDDRHIDVLHEISLRLPANSHIIEVGSHSGASTTAYIEAMHVRPDLTLDIYEIDVIEPLRKLLGGSGLQDRIALHERPLWEDPPTVDPALYVLDDDHKWSTLANLSLGLRRNPRVIVMHDVSSKRLGQRRGCWGSVAAFQLLINHAPSFSIWLDEKKRPHEQTDRGFAVLWQPAGSELAGLPEHEGRRLR